MYLAKKNPLLGGIGGGMFPFQIKLGNILSVNLIQKNFLWAQPQIKRLKMMFYS